MSVIYKGDLKPKFYIEKKTGVSYIRPSIMAFNDGKKEFTDYSRQGQQWIEHMEKIRDDFEQYKLTDEYSVFCKDFDLQCNRNFDYFQNNILRQVEYEYTEDDPVGIDYTEKKYRPICLEFLRIGEKLKHYSLGDLLFYDYDFIVQKIKPKDKDDIEKDVVSFVSKYGLLGFLSEDYKLEIIHVPEKYREMVRKNMESEGFPPERLARFSNFQMVGTFLDDAENALASVVECFLNSGFAVDTDAIETPAVFTYSQGHYGPKDRYRPRKGKTLRGAFTRFDYSYKHENKIYEPFFHTVMSADEYIGRFFPTHSEILGSLKGLQWHGLYSEPVSLFLYAAKVFYLHVMYVRQMFAQRKKSVMSKNTAEPKEIFLNSYIENIEPWEIVDSRTYYALLELTLKDIVNKRLSLMVCPWCGAVKQMTGVRKIKGTVYCKLKCELEAKKRRDNIKHNKPEKIKNYHNVEFRPALKEEIPDLLKFFIKHSKHPISATEEEEILSCQTEKPKASLFVAELDGEIICLFIKERDMIHQFNEDTILTSAMSFAMNKKFKHTNVLTHMIDWLQIYRNITE